MALFPSWSTLTWRKFGSIWSAFESPPILIFEQGMDKNKLYKKNRRDDQNFSLNKPYLLKRKFDND